MQEQIIYLTGTACPYDESKIQLEHAKHQQEVALLKSSGADIIDIGGCRNGFALTDVENAFKGFHYGNTVIVNVHGNTENNNHYLAISRDIDKNQNRRIWVDDLYKCMAQAAGQKPLNVFMLSCGSGDGYEAVPLLPRGSTVFNLTEQCNIPSYWLKDNAYRIKRNHTLGIAEDFFLNVLLNGFHEDARYTPQITISAAGDSFDNVWTLWDVARDECTEGEMLTRCMESGAAEFFANYATDKDIAEAVQELDFWEGRFIRLKSENTVLPSYNYRKDLHGLACALGYFLNRERIGAFQTKPLEYYDTPVRISTVIECDITLSNVPP